MKQFILQSYGCDDLEYSELLKRISEGEIKGKPVFVFPGEEYDTDSAIQDRKEGEYAVLKRERQRFNDNLGKIAKKASLNKDVASHISRRSIIKKVQEDSDLKTAQDTVARHKDISTTARYAENEKDERKETYTPLRDGSD